MHTPDVPYRVVQVLHDLRHTPDMPNRVVQVLHDLRLHCLVLGSKALHRHKGNILSAV